MARHDNPPAAEIARRRGGVRNGAGWLIRCPVPSHGRGKGDRNPSLSITDGAGGRLLVKCFAGCDPRDVLRALGCDSTENAFSRGTPAKVAKPAKVGDAERTAKARAIWREAVPAAGTLVETYLRSRSITIDPPLSLRFHPRLWHVRARRAMPAMVAGVQDPEGRIVAVHRTWLAADGSCKAAVDPQKAAIGPCRGSAVRLAAAGEALQLAEGVETGLALLQATEAPTWVTLGTGGLAAVILPEAVRTVIICADGDAPGEVAAITAAERFTREGRHVRIARPPAGLDFNDVLQGVTA